MTFQDSVSSDEIYTAVATFALVELGKRLPDKWVPLKAENANDVKFAAGLVSFVVTVFRMWQTGQFNVADLKTTLAVLVQTWLISWFFAHTAYKVIPFIGKKPEVIEQKPEEAQA